MWALWLLMMFGGFGLAVFASGRSVGQAEQLARGLNISPFVVGGVLMSIGTDLPEIANSIIASLSGHGDVNVGDSIGSAAAQVTLVLGLVPLIAGGFKIDSNRVAQLGAFTVAGLCLGAVLFSDGVLSRADAGLLLTLWAVSVWHQWQGRELEEQPELPLTYAGRARQSALVIGWLLVVAAGASAGVYALIELAAELAVPEYLISFFVASIGTSLPELMVDLTAVRRGHAALAVGDAFGSSLVDVTLSVSAGPLLMPNLLTAELAIRGSVAAALVIGAVTLLLWRTGYHGRVTGVLLLLGYAMFFPAMLL